jgi:hypothetical protein
MGISKFQEQDQISPDERRRAMTHLIEGRDILVRCLTGLTETQWTFKPSLQRWSILEVLEHLLIFETTVHGLISSMEDLPVDNSNHNAREVEQFILTTVPDRSKKLRTVIQGEPTGRLKSGEALDQFLLARARTQKLLDESTYLRGRIIPNPLYTVSDWDGYLWILALALHTIRHTVQIEELKNGADLPLRDDVSAIN